LAELENAQNHIPTAALILDDCYKNRGMNTRTLSLLKDHRQVVSEAFAKLPKEDTALMSPAPPAKRPADQSGGMPALGQLVLVGGAGALVLALVAYFQIKEIRRRRLRNTAGPGA
jgi:hypothetical protein